MRKFWPSLIGFIIWAVAFIALYALQGLGCAWGWPEAMHRGVLLAAWISTLALLGLVLAWQVRRPPGAEKLNRRVGISLTVVATAATVVTYFPVIFASLCL